MEQKTARLTLLIDPIKKAAFERLCATQDRTASQVVRQLIRDYLVEHGVTYVDSGAIVSDETRGEGTADGGTAKRAKPRSKRGPQPGSKTARKTAPKSAPRAARGRPRS